ncbi:methenyltetrahydrofolate synthase domain-containing protein-like [Glandiceps talaboti]
MANDITKASIRLKIWDYLEANNLANFPRPVHHRIPNFKGAAAANDRLKELDVFRLARTVKINPDKPQEHARFLTLEANKTLLVPTPRLRNGLFNKIIPPKGANKDMLRKCSTSQGVKEFSVPIGLDDPIRVDVVIVGSVAVSTKGYRIGKGEGFADMEYAMMKTMGAVNDNTVVISTVHDCQVMDIPGELFDDHDLSVDYILTPTRTIKCDGNLTQPSGIIWSMLTKEKFEKIPVLKNLRYREKKAGKDVRLKYEIESGESEKNGTESSHQTSRQTSKTDPKTKGERSDDDQTSRQSSTTESKARDSKGKNSDSRSNSSKRTMAIFVGGISRDVRVSEFKTTIREHNVFPIKVVWHGGRGFAFLHFTESDKADEAVVIVNTLTVQGSNLRAEMAK